MSQLTKEEKIQIKLLHNLEYSNRKIGKTINRHHSVISRELKRGIDPRTGKYDEKISSQKNKEKRINSNKNNKKIKANSDLEAHIYKQIRAKWSPEQISNTLMKSNLPKVSHETIYNHIYNLEDKALKTELLSHFRQTKGKYRRRAGTAKRAKEREELNKKRIETRPVEVETRTRIGDWEGDTIVGLEKSIHILTHVDRKSGYLLADKLDTATAKETQNKTIARFNILPNSKKHTCTYDNGVQFSLHQSTEIKAKIDIYFANPYHSWERGTNENTNGLLRQYYPKKTPFKDITQAELDLVVHQLNHRPRKRLGYLTPYQVFVLELQP